MVYKIDYEEIMTTRTVSGTLEGNLVKSDVNFWENYATFDLRDETPNHSLHIRNRHFFHKECMARYLVF